METKNTRLGCIIVIVGSITFWGFIYWLLS